VSEMVTHVESLIGTVMNETWDTSSGVEVKEGAPSAPIVTELVTQEAETLAVETVESLVEANVSVNVDASSGVDVNEETLVCLNLFPRQQTFLC
jgi:hypothetical protein